MPPTASAPFVAARCVDGRRDARRVAIGGFEIEWQPLGPAGGSPGSVRALVVNLSVQGARVSLAPGRPLAEGSLVRIGLGNGAGTCVVRWSKPGSAGPTSCGVEFVWLDQVLNDAIHDLVVRDRGSLDEHWRLVR